METIKRWIAKLRIIWLRAIGRAHTFKFTDEAGEQHEATVERTEEKVCPHNTLKEIAPTLWACANCTEYYCMINYRVHVPRPQLVQYVEKIAGHLGATLRDKEPPIV